MNKKQDSLGLSGQNSKMRAFENNVEFENSESNLNVFKNILDIPNET